jgi:hypothetical protein
MEIKTGCWFTDLPTGHTRIGISRGVPLGITAGYRVYRVLAPGRWFNSVGVEEYYHLYRTKILGPLDPRIIASHLVDLARGGIPVMLGYERPGGFDLCHRAIAGAWLAEALGHPVPEVGFEHLAQQGHPLMPAEFRR